MGKTYRKDNMFRSKKKGRVFNKEIQPWKKQKPRDGYIPPTDPQ